MILIRAAARGGKPAPRLRSAVNLRPSRLGPRGVPRRLPAAYRCFRATNPKKDDNDLASPKKKEDNKAESKEGKPDKSTEEKHDSQPLHSTGKSSSETSDVASTKDTGSNKSDSSASDRGELVRLDTSKMKKYVYWENYKYKDVQEFSDLPSTLFGYNQHMIIDTELKEAFGLMLRQFKAPIRFCFAYGSGVFPQSKDDRSITEAEFRAVHPKPPEALMKTQRGRPKMIDFIFGVTHTEHFHSLNMRHNRDHYSGLARMGSAVVSGVQEGIGAGVYFNPYVVVNGMLIKYGVTSIENLCHDLTTWETLYLAGRLHKPVKILRDNAAVRIANQQNLMAAIRVALLMLPEQFNETELYSTIAGISYLGDPRMSFPTENPSKVTNIVSNNMLHFRRLYGPLISVLPNVEYKSAVDPQSWEWMQDPAICEMQQDMNVQRRANMLRRLPSSFRSRLYFQYQKKYQITRSDFNKLMEEAKEEKRIPNRVGRSFERRIAKDDPIELRSTVRRVIKQTVSWPATSQSLKSVLTAGIGRSLRYLREKWASYDEGKKAVEANAVVAEVKDDAKEKVSEVVTEEEKVDKAGVEEVEKVEKNAEGETRRDGGEGADKKTP